MTAPVLIAAALTEAQREVLGQALADAIERRGDAGWCADCQALIEKAVQQGSGPPGPCADCAADLDRADAYLALARELGIELEQDL